jgi:GNAT superfamily N-acetyltransferase
MNTMLSHDYQIHVVNTTQKRVRDLEAMQRLCYPTLTEIEIFTAEKYLHHLKLFPQGQFVALAEVNGREIPVGSTTTYRTDFDFAHIEHTFQEAIADGWLSNHDDEGEWLYGVDMMVHPKFQGRGIAGKLYKARRDLAIQLNLRGEIAGGMLPGYDQHRKNMTIEQYVKAVVTGKLKGPTISAQLKYGFKVRAILYNHITDPRSDNAATLIVRENPNYHSGDNFARAG